MSEALIDLLVVLLLLIVGIFVWLALSPFELLGWWAGWFGDRIYWETTPDEEEINDAEPRSAYVVFFSGVGRATGETLSYRERDFLRRLAEANPDAQIIDDIFPYAVNNLALTSQPWLARLWRFSLRSKANGIPIAGMLINLRNIMQILISADKRYGPLFNQGVAEVTVNGLIRHGYSPERNAPILVIGYSGAGQVAVGCSMYIKEWTRSPVHVISLAGVFGSDPSLLHIDHLYHIVGNKDTVVPWSFMAPGRWPFFATSEWNRALRQGRVTRIDMGPMKHTGAGGYLDAKTALPDGTQYVDQTVRVVTQILKQAQARWLAASEQGADDGADPPASGDTQDASLPSAHPPLSVEHLAATTTTNRAV